MGLMVFAALNKRFFYLQIILLDLIIKGGERFERANSTDQPAYFMGFHRAGCRWRA